MAISTTLKPEQVYLNLAGTTLLRVERQDAVDFLNQVLAGGASVNDVSTLADRITIVEDGQATGYLLRSTWAALSADAGTADGAGAEVLDSDAGTHGAATASGYDGAAVANGGRYSWNAAWARWVRIGDSALSARAPMEGIALPCDVAGTANAPSLTPKAGYTLQPGAENLFQFVATAANTGNMIVFLPALLGADARQLLLPAGAGQVPVGAIQIGDLVTIKYGADGQFQLVTPVPMRCDVVPTTQTNVSDNSFLVAPVAGAFPASNQAVYTMSAPSDRGAGEWPGVTMDIAGVTGELRQVRYPPGDPIDDQIGEHAWRAGDVLRFRYNPAGFVELLYPPRPAAAASDYDARAAFFDRRANQIAAIGAQQ